MKKTTKVMMLAAMMFVGTAAFAGPRGHHHEKRDGLDLAAGIVGLVMQVINPQPTVIVNRPAVVHHRPTVIHTQRHEPQRRPAARPAAKPARRPAPRRR